MYESAFLTLVHNAALLITLAYAYSLISVYEREQTPLYVKALLGIVVSAIGLSIMVPSLGDPNNIAYDARSVLMAGSALFLGLTPTLIAMSVTGILQWMQGGIGAPPGVGIILASGAIGLVWRNYRRDHLAEIGWRELYFFGVVVHLVMLIQYFMMPIEQAVLVLKKVTLPILIVYPLVTTLFGRMMSLRLQRERQTQKVRQSEEWHRSLFQNNHTVMLILDPEDGRVVEANPAAETFYGMDRGTLLDQRLYDLTAGDDTSRDKAIHDALDHAGGGGVSRLHKGAGGDRRVEMFCNRIVLDGSPLLYAMVYDMSEQEKLQEQLRQAQKMEAVGWLAGGVAHDYNNKLQAILGFAEISLRETGDNTKLKNYLNEIRRSARHSAQLTMQLMAFARKQPIQPQVLALNSTISNMLKMLKNVLGEDIELSWKPGKDIWHVKIDPSQIDRILVNLAMNARDAISDVGKLTLQSRNVNITEEYARQYPDANEGEFVLMSIEDTGEGINQEDLEHIFEPFYTTKGVGKGTGLGLATVYGIVRQNSGFIRVRSTIGQGTTFEIYLPRTLEPLPSALGDTVPEKKIRGDETILVVEDEKLVLDLVHHTLEADGYSIITAGDPHEALERISQHPGEIDMLVTDVVMPGMNGKDLYDEIVKHHPEVKVLFMSGYTANAIMDRGVLDPGIHYIQKPFSISDISSRVREVLDGQPANT